MNNEVRTVEWHGTFHLEGFEKYNKDFCFLKISGNPNLPEKIGISKNCFTDNYEEVLKIAVDNEKYDILCKGRIKKYKNTFNFIASGNIELVPTPLWTEEELTEEIDSFFNIDKAVERRENERKQLQNNSKK